MTEDGRMEIQKEKNGKVPNGSPKTGIEGEREKIHSLLEEFAGSGQQPGFIRRSKKIEAETGIRGKTGALSGRGVCGHPGVS